MLSFDEIQELIVTPKKIVKTSQNKGSRQWTDSRVLLKPVEENGSDYEVFLKQNVNLTDSFSIGLRFRETKYDPYIILVRYNGLHDRIPNQPDNHHTNPHIHILTPEDLKRGLLEPKPGKIVITDEYYEFAEASEVFHRDTNIVDNYLAFVPENLRYRDNKWTNIN